MPSRTGAYRYIAKAIRTTNYAAVVPPPEVYCREVDECPKRPVVVFEENYSKFSDLCPLCGFAQYGEYTLVLKVLLTFCSITLVNITSKRKCVPKRNMASLEKEGS